MCCWAAFSPTSFRRCLAQEGDQPLDADTVRRQFAELAASLPGRDDVAALAAGCIRIAVENMANAIKKISVQRGHDITEYTLTCFGGAAGQHACLVADALGMRSVFIHPLAGVLSAYGIGLADTLVMRQQTAEVPLNAAALEQLGASYTALEQRGARRNCVQQGFAASSAQLERSVLLKYSDTDSTLTLPLLPDSTPETLTAEFLAQYRTRFGFHVPGRAIVIDTIGVTATGRSPDVTGARAHLCAARRRADAHRHAAGVLRWRLGRHAVLRTRSAAPGRCDRGTRRHLRTQHHRGRRTRMARDADRG